MSAAEYMARADVLVDSADASASLEMILELEAAAATWRKLAALADLQDSLKAALVATRG